MSQNKKSKAKRMGVKSVFSHGDRRLVITRFGRGNSAEIAVESDAHGKELSLPHRMEKSFTVQKIGEEIDLVRGVLDTVLNNPADEVPEDYLGLKGTLEKIFFGKDFPMDSVRIQIIHNLLDIQKILGIYINDIIYTIANLQKMEKVEDCLGRSLNNEQAGKILKEIRPYMGYLGAGFKTVPNEEKRKPKKVTPGKRKETDALTEADAFNLSSLRILSTVRNNLAHFRKSFFFLFSDKLNTKFTGNMGNWKTIDQHYEDMINRINQSFLRNSRTNLTILYDVLHSKTPGDEREIAEEYYRFCILKEGKNLGINMRKLREIMVEAYYPDVKDKRFDSYRQKIYTILDFLLFREMKDSEELESMVAKLRETSDDAAKEELYQTFAKLVWERVEDFIVPYFAHFDGDFTVFVTAKVPDTIQNIGLSTEAEPLVKLLAFLCNFWDGKEVNELLSAYIHKFESIQSFIDVLESSQMNDKVEFSNTKEGDFSAFNKPGFAGRVAAQLRVLASIGKMKPDLSETKRALFRDAVEMLGIKNQSDLLDSKGNLSNDKLEEYILPGKSVSEADKKAINPFRNFIVNNVIKSRRFQYLTRYTNPQTVRELMNHADIIRYVLTRLPEKQIDTYYANISDPVDVTLNMKITKLTQALTGFSFNSLFLNRKEIVANSKLDTSNKNLKIERLKALTGLYLTVAFVAVKNLVKINARYFIAFATRERDYELMRKKDSSIEELGLPFKTDQGKDSSNTIFALTEYFLKKEVDNDYHPAPGQPFDKEACRKHLNSIHRHFTKKWRDIFRSNIDEALAVSKTGYLGTAVRNHAAHMNVLTQALPKFVKDFHSQRPGMTSYFELYHFLLQKLMYEHTELRIPDKWKRYVEAGVPCEDWIKVAYVSLGYCLPRYKNLTIESLFDEDSESGKKMAERNVSKKS